MQDNNTTLKVENVSKHYGEFTAVGDLSFDVRAGRVFGFLGPNGAGKTTVGRKLAGALGWRFLDADDEHPAVNIAKMKAGKIAELQPMISWICWIRKLWPNWTATATTETR